MRVFAAGLIALFMASLTLGGQAAAADQPAYGAEPAWVDRLPIPAKTAGPGAPALQVLLWNCQTRLADTRLADTRLNEAGQDTFTEVAMQVNAAEALNAAGSVATAWDPETQSVTVNRVRVLRGAQVIDALAGGRKFIILRREKNLEAVMLDGQLTGTLQVEGLQVGDIIDVAITVHTVQPVLKGRLETALSIAHQGEFGRLYLKEAWPQASALRWRVSNDLAAPVVARQGEWSTLTYDFKDAATPPAPNDAPVRYQLRGLVEVTQFDDWSQLSALMTPLYDQAARILPGSPLRQAVDHLRATTPSDPRARALAALRLVQDQTRYVFIALNNGAYIPVAAETTWSRRFGDCKAKAALLLAILRDLGIEAQPALVNSALGDGLDRRLPTLSAFDHVMVRATIAGQVYWLDGTRIGDRSLDDERSQNLKWALPLSVGGHAALERIAPLIPTQPLEETRVTLDASAGLDKVVKIDAQRTFRGDAAVGLDLLFRSLDRAEQDRKLRAVWTQDYTWVDIGSVSYSFDPDRRTITLSVHGSGRVSWFEQAGARYLDLADTSLGWNASFRRDPGPDQDAPYAVAYPSYAQTHLTVILPDKGRAAALSNGGDVGETIAGTAYSRTAQIDDGRLEVVSTSRGVAPDFPADEATHAQSELQSLSLHDVMLRAPLEADAAVRDASAVAVTPSVDHGAAAAGGDATALAADGANHLEQHDYAAAVADFSRAMQMAPGSSKYVYDRGAAHYAARQDALAVQDFDAAIRLDPKDALARFARARLALSRGDTASAKRDLDAAVAAAPNREGMLLRTSAIYERAQDYADAVGAYDLWLQQAATQSDEMRATVLNDRCWARAEWGRDLDAAIKDCDASLKLYPNSAATLDSRALADLRLGRLDAAIADSTWALKLRPDSSGTLYTRALAQQRSGQAAQAAVDFRAAAALDPKTAATYAKLGLRPS